MILQAPEYLWFLLLAIPLILLHLRRKRKQTMAVASLELWSSMVDRLPQDRRRFRFFSILSLLTSLLALSVFTVVAAGPVFQEGHRYVLILDTSVSMNVKDQKGRTRFEEAKDRLLQFLKSIPIGDAVAFFVCGGERVPMTHDRTFLKKRISEATIEWEKHSAHATAVSAQTKYPEDLLIVASDFNTTDAYPTSFMRIVVGNLSSTNTGIVNAQISGRGENAELSIELYSDVGTSRSVRMRVLFQGKTVRTMDVGFPSGQRSQVRLSREKLAISDVDFRAGGVIMIQIEDEQDCLQTDNTAYVYVRPEPKRGLYIVSGGKPNPFLVEALLLHSPDVIDYERREIITLDQYQKLTAQAVSDDLFVFDGVLPDSFESGRFLLFSSDPQVPGVVTSETRKGPGAVHWNAHWPTDGYRSYELFHIQSVRVIPRVRGMIPVLSSDEDVLIMACPSAKRRLMYVGFQLDETNFVLQPSFPLFIRHSLEWLSEEHRSIPEMQTLGTFVDPQTDTPALIRRIFPPGQAKGWDRFPVQPDEPGLYEYVYTGEGDQQEWFCVNMFNEVESAIRPTIDPKSSALPTVASETDQYRRLLLLIGFTLIVCEWLILLRVKQ